MAPSPITLLDNNLGLTSTNMFRNSWGDVGPQLDPKVVGSHLPLGKRNSTPVGVGGTPHPHHHSHHFNPLKVAAHLAAHNSMANTPTTPGGGMTGGNDSSSPVLPPNPHRALDRCHSEPVKPQQQQQQQPQQQPMTSSSRYKTELCRPFAETGFCKYGEKCQFAHGGGELRNMPRHPKYKTELCRTFHTTGLCGYGTRCHFIHNAEERRNPSPHAFGNGMRGPDDHNPDMAPPLQNLSPPASLHGSPTSSVGAFFGDTFSLMNSPLGGSGSPHHHDDSPFSMLSLETPPVSPVESLAGDIESLSLSPALSDSPSPPMMSHHYQNTFLDTPRYARLPIFQSLKEM